MVKFGIYIPLNTRKQSKRKTLSTAIHINMNLPYNVFFYHIILKNISQLQNNTL